MFKNLNNLKKRIKLIKSLNNKGIQEIEAQA
jgi:hypothetical protein